MKSKIIFFTFTITLVTIFCPASRAQIFEKIKREVKNRTENKVVNKAGKTTDNTLDKVLEKPQDARQKNKSVNESAQAPDKNKRVSEVPVSKKNTYASYDFVPGDKIIFQPDLSGEEDAELPARFKVLKGNVEIQTHEGEKFLHINKGGYAFVAPLMNNDSYLPEQFTLEFDLMYENDRDIFDQFNDFAVQFYTAEDQNFEGYGLGSFIIMSNESTMLGKPATSKIKAGEDIQKALQTPDTWHHIALYFRKNIAKAYIGGTRVSATNIFPVGAAKFVFKTDGRYGYKIKNVRLAAGGDDKYNKIVTEGKFITHGILFDVNKSTIKDESMGTLNEIIKMMKDHPDLKFEINGHTDSDGKAEANFKLSEDRANAVKTKLISMGIEENRLTIKGNGDTRPIDSNSTPEGKANNRRVEFIKL